MELPTSEQFQKLSVANFNTEKLLTNAARQRDARKFNDFPIIDTDAHQYETESISEIIEYIDDEVLQHLGYANPGFFSGGRGGYQPMGGRITRYPLRKIEETPSVDASCSSASSSEATVPLNQPRSRATPGFGRLGTRTTFERSSQSATSSSSTSRSRTPCANASSPARRSPLASSRVNTWAVTRIPFACASSITAP